jgi:hypothetical protein
MTPSFFSLLMCDAAKLLRPSTVVAISTTGNPDSFMEHPSANALLVLSDTSTLFQSQPAKSSAPNPITAKLAFYAARIVSTPSYVLIALADEAVARAKLVEREEQLNKASPAEAAQGPSSETRMRKPRIEELT